jgi:hypothetical protein
MSHPAPTAIYPSIRRFQPQFRSEGHHGCRRAPGAPSPGAIGRMERRAPRSRGRLRRRLPHRRAHAFAHPTILYWNIAVEAGIYLTTARTIAKRQARRPAAAHGCGDEHRTVPRSLLPWGTTTPGFSGNTK